MKRIIKHYMSRRIKFSNFIYLVLFSFIPLIFESCTGGGNQNNNVPNSYPPLEIVAIEPDHIFLGQEFRVRFQVNLSSTTDIRMEVKIWSSNQNCIIYDGIVDTENPGQGDRSLNFDSDNFSINGCNLINSLDNKSYEIRLYSTGLSSMKYNLLIGTNTFNVRYYNPMESMPNGWLDLENTFINQVQTTLFHTTNPNGQLPCVPVDVLDLSAFLHLHNNITHFDDHLYDNSCFLIGHCEVTNTAPLVYGYSEFRTTGPSLSERIPGRAWVFVQKISMLLQQNGWTTEKKDLAKHYIAAHELGHVRGNFAHTTNETHDATFGSKWDECCMAPLAYDYAGLKTDLQYCSKHAHLIKLNWW